MLGNIFGRKKPPHDPKPARRGLLSRINPFGTKPSKDKIDPPFNALSSPTRNANQQPSVPEFLAGIGYTLNRYRESGIPYEKQDSVFHAICTEIKKEIIKASKRMGGTEDEKFKREVETSAEAYEIFLNTKETGRLIEYTGPFTDPQTFTDALLLSMSNFLNLSYNYTGNSPYFDKVFANLNENNAMKNLAGLVAAVAFLNYKYGAVTPDVVDRVASGELGEDDEQIEQSMREMALFANMTWRIFQMYDLVYNGRFDRFDEPTQEADKPKKRNDFRVDPYDLVTKHRHEEIFMKDIVQIRSACVWLSFINAYPEHASWTFEANMDGFDIDGMNDDEREEALEGAIATLLHECDDCDGAGCVNDKNKNFRYDAMMKMRKEIKDIQKGATHLGGAPGRKIRILGRERRVYKEGRTSYVVYNKRHVTLAEAKMLEKQMAAGVKSKKTKTKTKKKTKTKTKKAKKRSTAAKKRKSAKKSMQKRR
jgi:hypothetical protein